ncbi:MAG: oligosaccharide flippase family protein [Anaerovoracaceae bacterium]|nr:oligosaccharide flippase family protein [Anaerovoracaceae bacterium]
MREIIKNKINDLLKKGAADIMIGNFAVKFVTLCGSMFIVRLLTKTEYGVYGYVENLYSYIYILSGLGLSVSALRYNVLAESMEEKKGIFRYITKRQTVINFVIYAAVIAVGLFYPHPEKYSAAVYLLPIMALSLPFQDVTQSCLNNERANYANRRYAVFSVTIAAISVVSRVIGSWLFGLNGTVTFKTVGECLITIFLIFMCYNKYFKGTDEVKPDPALKKQINKYGFQNMISNGIWVLFMITDIFLIGKLCKDPTALADYKVAYLFPSNMSIITASVGVFITPYFIKHETDYRWVKRSFFKTFLANAALVCTFALLLYVLARPVVCIIYGRAYLNVVPLMRILIIAHTIHNCFKNLIGNLLAAMGHVRTNIVVSSIGFVSEVTMGIIVIPRYGTTGLAIGSIFVYTMMSVIMMITFAVQYRFFSRSGADDE